jgi:hypothetical protein
MISHRGTELYRRIELKGLENGFSRPRSINLGLMEQAAISSFAMAVVHPSKIQDLIIDNSRHRENVFDVCIHLFSLIS